MKNVVRRIENGAQLLMVIGPDVVVFFCFLAPFEMRFPDVSPRLDHESQDCVFKRCFAGRSVKSGIPHP